MKSFASVLSHLKPLRDHFGDWRAVGITFRAIEAYITTRREDEKSNATINQELELLRRALRLAHDRQLLLCASDVSDFGALWLSLGATSWVIPG